MHGEERLCVGEAGLDHGNYWRVDTEFLLLGVRGNCPFLDQSPMSWRGWNGLRGEVWRGGRVGGIRLRGRGCVESCGRDGHEFYGINFSASSLSI